VMRGPGKFEPREVILGVSSDGLVQILSGVRPGEEVVASSQFLIDSESKLREATAKMLEALQAGTDRATLESDAGVAPATPHDMSAMETTPAATGEPVPLPTQVPGSGIVKKVMREEHKINIEHEPIEELDWPTMTMDFVVAADVGLTDVNTGDRVRFTLNPDAGNQYVITAMQEIQTAPAPTPAEAEIMAMGIVKEVRASERKLNITHDPIAALGWPAMTMDFAVAAEVDLAGLEPGVQIHFNLERDAAGSYVITFIHAME